MDCLLCCICGIKQTVQSRVTATAEVVMSETMTACFAWSPLPLYSPSHQQMTAAGAVPHAGTRGLSPEFDIVSMVDVKQCVQGELCGRANIQAHVAFHQRYTKVCCQHAVPVKPKSLASMRGHTPRHSTFCSAATIKRRMQTVPAVLPAREILSLLPPA